MKVDSERVILKIGRSIWMESRLRKSHTKNGKDSKRVEENWMKSLGRYKWQIYYNDKYYEYTRQNNTGQDRIAHMKGSVREL